MNSRTLPAQMDGRRMRSARSRESIVHALFELVGEGRLQPTAQQVAERAGVDIRTVFRHFSDMDTLFVEMDQRLRDEVRPLLDDVPADGTLEDRAAALVARRVEIFERITPYKRSANLQRRRSVFLQREHRDHVRMMRVDLMRWLPELSDAPEDLVEALDQVTSFEAWDRLREEQRLATRRALSAMERSVVALVRGLVD
ncbi:MAG: TetR family transcriptional regulator [Myxococcota bacterium]